MANAAPKSAQEIADSYLPEKVASRIPREDKDSDIRDAKVLELSKHGLTQTAIAQQLGITQPTVSRILDKYVDTRTLAKLRLHNSAASLTERVIREADVEQALEVLDRLEVAARRQNASGNTAVQVIVNMPGQTHSEPPMLEGNVISSYQTQKLSEGESGQ